MKARFLLLLTFYLCVFFSPPITAWSQTQPIGKVIGNQTVISIPVAPAGYPTAQALIYYPDDYFLPENANKRYPLFLFNHGTGEGSSQDITEVTNQSVPYLIKNGLKPYGIDQVTGDTIKFIVVSPHCASCGSSYFYPQLQYTIPYLFSTYRIDTSCAWVGGLSAGGRATWSVVMGMAVGDTALGKRITGIMPMANGGYDDNLSTLGRNLDTIARRGLRCLYVIGDQDPGYNGPGFFAYQAHMQANSQPGNYLDKVIIGGTHSANVWNVPFPENARIWSTTMNAWTQMWSMRRTVVTSTPTPAPPTVSAGTDQTITLPSTLTLTGTATANGGTTISGYAWTQTGGPNTATITTPSSATTTVTNLAAGVYTFSLTVTASDGSSTTKTVQITVNGAAPAPNTAPVANAGSDQTITLPTSTATLTGSATDADGNGTITSYAWTQVSGPNTATFTAAGAAGTDVTGLIQGTYVFKLTVTDDQGATGTAQVSVIVNAATPTPNSAPVANAGSNQTITLPASTATLTGSATDADGNGTISSYAWTQVSGPNTATFTAAGAAGTDVTGLVQGTYVFKLTVTDNQGATGTAQVSVIVNAATPPPNTAPVAAAGSNQTITLPTSTATLAGSGTDADGDYTIASYAWTQVSGPNTAVFTAASSATTTVTGLVQGTYTFKLTVTDDQGATGTAQVNVVVNAAPPPPPPGSPVVTKVACTEYQAAWLYSDGTCRTFAFNNTSGHVEFMPFNIGGRKAVDASTGFNRITILDDQGYVWLNNGGAVTAVRWDTDNTGAAFDGNVAIFGYFYTYLSIRNDGSIWYWGGDDYKFFGGTAVPKPVKINQPAGVKFVKLATGSSLLGLTTTGDVYQWDKGSMNFTKVNLPRPASDICASHMAFFIAVIPDDISTSKLGWPYAWGSESKFWGGSGASYANTSPQPLKTLWNMTVPIKLIASNQNTVHYIDANGDMYGIGDNPNGEIGNGEELVNHAEKYPTPYAWSWTKYEMLTGAPPIHILPGTKFKNIYTGNTFVFYNYASDVNDSLYFWGRNKSFVGGDGVVNGQEATYPNALDILTPTMRTPLGVKPTQTASYNFTPYTLKCPAKQTIITTSTVLSATSTASTLVTGGKPNYGYTIVKYQWTKVSGPSSYTITNPNALSTTVTGLTTGTYIFNIQTTDNNTGTISARDTIVVNNVAPGVPVADAGADQTITLPTNSVTLTGTGQENGGTIVSYKWTQLSGPNTATFANANAASTGVSGLVAGAYVFQLTITDNSGVTATDAVTVTVKPAAPPGPPSANAGGDQTITLPTSSLTVAGSGSETNGTIVSYKWTQVSGPNTATIANANAASTGISGLVAGNYVMQLTVTDNSGVTASDVMTITVKPAIVPGPPSANAGADQTITLPTSSVNLAGSGSETNGTIVSYKWTQVSGPNTATFSNANAAATSASGLVAGNYVFQLMVTDNSGKTATDVVTITVKPAVVPGPPSANAGTDQTITLPTNSGSLSGAGSETNGTIVSYKWTQVSGPNTATIANANTPATGISGLVQGIYVFQLTVTDNSGVTATDVTTVTVNPAVVTPGSPVVDAGANQTITLPSSSMTLTGTASETGGTIDAYKWTQVSGPNTANISNDAQASTYVDGLVAGVYTFQLTVTDNSGVTASDIVKVTVNPAATPGTPVVDAGANQTIQLPTNTVTLTGVASEANGTIVSYKWTQVSGPNTATIATDAQASTVINNMAEGAYTFQLTVTDNSGVTASDIVKITVTAAVAPGTPVVDAGANQTITLPASMVTLTGVASETNGTIVSYKWTQVSGPNTATIATDAQATTDVTGLVQGAYTFQLTVTDNSGVTASDIVKVTVNAAAANQPPVAVPGADMNLSTVTPVPLDGSGSYDPDGTIVKYQWLQISGAGGVTITGSNTDKPTVYGLEPGTYVFQLTVTDDKGATDTKTITVTITDPTNQLPIADAGHDTTLIFPGQTGTLLDGRGSSDPDGTLTYSWKQVSGPSTANIDGATNSFTGVSGLVVGDYTFQLTVTDDKNAKATAVVRVHVLSDLRHNGYIKIYPNPVRMDQMMTLEGSTDSASVMKFTIFDVQGRIVKQSVYGSQFSTFRFNLPMAGLNKGFYVLSVEFNGGGKPQVYKFLVD